MKNWSETYFTRIKLTKKQHKENNVWFEKTINNLEDNRLLKVPTLGKFFNKQGKETDGYGNLKYDYFVADFSNIKVS
ncbi:hypothetical protein [Candidatus Sulfurimonas baltica]|uniref:Uncharacterized protein n=1 Tax=Candidatus Sulfurimonas baltica TaxID=2740404 RepID=A0A7S7RNN6_9BACT|nr:hypothetical protein [Candidatus Sulfurimonas baltica]QOY52736.1 hypothetical protein HUE88_03360 [Candidatus Sulfurimonas baltica]